MNTLMGTPLYLPPEVIEKKYNYKCDLWSLGILTFIMLCG
jgi:calcium-dependent protein kinase